MAEIDYLTAETEAGCRAIAEVANNAIPAAVDIVPPGWAIVRRVNGEAVSFALIDPERMMRFGKGAIRYGYIHTIATRADRRARGHFRAMLDEAFRRLKLAGLPFVVLHGANSLYRRFGFEGFTHHSGIFITPGAIEHCLGDAPQSPGLADLIEICESQLFLKDLLYVTHASAGSLEEARGSMLAAAKLAREKNKARILIEHPDAPSYGSTYPVHASSETPLTALARACGGKVVLQGANPEDGRALDDDWIRVLDPLRLAEAVLDCRQGEELLAPAPARIWICTEQGSFGLVSDGRAVSVTAERSPEMAALGWTSGDVAQLATGFRPAAITAAIRRTPLTPACQGLLEAVFPSGWRFSRNASWVTQYPSMLA
jgi:hypothetical protein